MRPARRRIYAGAVMGAVLAGAAAPGFAQQSQPGSVPATKSGWSVVPEVTLSTVHDDNIFAVSSDPQSDWILQLSPGISLDYADPRTTFNIGYLIQADKYRTHSELDSWHALEQGDFGLDHSFSERFSGGLAGSYIQTNYPGELTPISGLVLERTRATSTSVQPHFSYRFTALTSAKVFYAWTRNDLTGEPRTDIGTGSLEVDHQLSRRDVLKFQAQNIQYRFEGDGSPASRVLTLGWTHEVSPQTKFTLSAGPRDTEGRVVPEILANFIHRSRSGSVSVTYTRSQVAVLGINGVIDTQAVQLGLSFTPVRRLDFSITPAYYRDSFGGQTVDVAQVGLDMNYELAPHWHVTVSYSDGRQSGTLGTAADQVIRRKVAAVALQWSFAGEAAAGSAIPAIPASP